MNQHHARKLFSNIVSSPSNIMHIETTDNTGRTMHVFLKANAFKRPMLEKSISSKVPNINYSEFGEVVASCHGRFPTGDVRKLMKEKFDLDC